MATEDSFKIFKRLRARFLSLRQLPPPDPTGLPTIPHKHRAGIRQPPRTAHVAQQMHQIPHTPAKDVVAPAPYLVPPVEEPSAPGSARELRSPEAWRRYGLRLCCRMGPLVGATVSDNADPALASRPRGRKSARIIRGVPSGQAPVRRCPVSNRKNVSVPAACCLARMSIPPRSPISRPAETRRPHRRRLPETGLPLVTGGDEPTFRVTARFPSARCTAAEASSRTSPSTRKVNLPTAARNGAGERGLPRLVIALPVVCGFVLVLCGLWSEAQYRQACMEVRPQRWGNRRYFLTRQRSGTLPPAEGLHGSTPPAMGESPVLPYASAVGDASPG